MRIFPISELLQLSRYELLELHRKISTHLLVLADNAIERREALENLDTIRRVLNRPILRPWQRGPMSPAP